MRRWIILMVIALLALSATAIAVAQDNNPTPPSGTVPLPPDQVTTPEPDDEEETDQPQATTVPSEEATAVPAEEAAAMAATVDVAAEPFITLDLQGGFAMDPFFVSVNGGGPLDASTLDPACVGNISEAPVITLNWSGTADFAQAFIYSDHNPSLVIETPAGDFICSDDTNDLLLDPTVEVTNPEAGAYHIWIGNEDNVGLIPTVFVLTSRTEVNSGTFDLQNLVKRPAVREVLLDAADAVAGGAEIATKLETMLAGATDVQTIDSGGVITASLEISGGVPGFLFPTSEASPYPVCTGIINPESAFAFTVGEGVDSLNVFVEADVDTSLIVVQPDGLAICTDDSTDGGNRNPQLLLSGLAPGNYGIAIGNVQPQGTAVGNVTITTDMSALPAMLEMGGAE